MNSVPFSKNRDPKLLDLLITHNRDDVLGMVKILPVLSYERTFSFPERGGSLRIPLFRGELKHFFSNHRDYLYIPSEDRAVLKTIGKLYCEKTEKATKDYQHFQKA